MASQSPSLHVIFFPLMAPGHILPMLHLAKLFAARGARATLLTTPANSHLLQPAVDGVSISLRLIHFPSAAVGLPPGRESLASVDFRQHTAFFEGIYMLEDPFRRALAELRPDAVVSDWFLPWTFDVAEEFRIPRLAFHGYSAFALCANASLLYAPPPPPPPGDEGSTSFVVPGFPRRLEMPTSQLPDLSKLEPVVVKIFQQIAEWETRSFGVVVNSFYDLETEFADHLRRAIWRRAWLVGPVASAKSFSHDGDDLSVSRWLDEQQDASVLYVCFGSVSSIAGAQLRELALGLEASGHPFIWVVRTDDAAAEPSWRPAGFAERTKQRRWLILEDWAPQAAILGHVAVGGFVTHCGWSSCMEAVAAGVPMATWPLFAEQFLNERLVTEVLGVGVSVGATHWTMDPEERPLIQAAEVERAARRVMDADGEEGRRMRTKARELALAAKTATAEGGSSSDDMGKLIKDLIDQKQ
ncbi:scopoletin glucosyltransferase-like [Zingiber officinale]|uniref:scopoletin glucosyltransferase-like n=1 Tax=Zingiber officinale TaxID=94328 RepID=UPI001C4B7E9E|nr:scopoletin glucosyltransferase-like [Zingiber officinale]